MKQNFRKICESYKLMLGDVLQSFSFYYTNVEEMISRIHRKESYAFEGG